MNDISSLRETICQSYSGISFSPEKRAAQDVSDLTSELSADLAELGDKAGDYASKYLQHVRTYYAKKARCLSPMITGPANFPTARNQKAFNAERHEWEAFRKWRERYIKRANRVRTPSPEEETDNALVELERAKELHAAMIGVNKIIRKKMSVEEQKDLISELYGWSEKTISKLYEPDCFGNIGFAGFTLTNHNAKIKRLEEKLVILRKRIERRDTFEPVSFPGGSITIEADRVIIKHDSKPAQEVISDLKSRGFHWSNTHKSWCRKHTANAIAAAKDICGVKQ